MLSCASLLLCGWDGEEEDRQGWPGCPEPPPVQVTLGDQTNPTDLLWPEICSIFNPFLELALFFKGPGPIPLSPLATQLPVKRELIYIFYLFAFCVGMGLCPVPGGLMWPL